MASKFLPGMKNVLEILNQMWDAFAAGPFNALPLTGGALTGPLQAKDVLADGLVSVRSTFAPGIVELMRLTANSGAAGNGGTAIKMGYPLAGYGTRIVSGGDATVAVAGYTGFEIGNGAGAYSEIARFSQRGALLLGTASDNGVDRLQVRGTAMIAPTGTQGTIVLQAGIEGANASVTIRAGNGGATSQNATVIAVSKNTNTDRGVDSTGTFNGLGNDYAEYIYKSPNCCQVLKGQLIGITSSNTITDRWAEAVMFAIKSTAPSYVGGDSWAIPAGQRPAPLAGTEPMPPARRPDSTAPDPAQPGETAAVPGDTDAEWAAKQAAYAAALASHSAAVQQDAEAMAAFEAALEVERQKVDRIAIAGRVPVNVMGAQPGDYIVPVQDGDGIAGIAVPADDIDMPQYLRAVGRVIAIEADGRAYVMVKAV